MSILDRLGKVWDKLGSVGKFVARYADEASDIADVFRTILPALPIGNNGRNKVLRLINRLEATADNIEDFLNKDPEKLEPVAVKASDVKKAVADYLNSNPDVIAKAIANTQKDGKNEGNE